MKRIVFVGEADGFEAFMNGLKDYEREGLLALRAILPAEYFALDAQELLRAWRDFSEDRYCAGFITVDKGTVQEFIRVTKIVDR